MTKLPASITEYLTASEARYVEELKAFLRIPSVSGKSEHASDCRTAAEWVARQLESAGASAEIVPTAGHPIVIGEIRTAGDSKPTVLVYGHYDVQPAEPLELWTSPPFEPTERSVDYAEGPHLFARGATDDKGQMFTHIKAVEAWTQAGGELPVNVVFVIEGEEEVGSNNLEPFLESNRDRLRCDVAVISDTSQYDQGIPAITYGLRGITACEIRLRGPNRDLHSGVFGGAVANPATVLCQLVGSLHRSDGFVRIPGFYDGVEPLTQDERDEFAALPFDESRWLSALGIAGGHGEMGWTTTERRWARPTCEINGLLSGYTGEGPKTIVPAEAMAKLTCRLVPNQDWAKITASLETYLRRQLPPGITMEFVSEHGAPGIVMDTTSPFMAAARTAIQSAFEKEPVLIREGGSIPVVSSLKQILGVDTLLLGWGQNTDRLHAPDERFSLNDFQRGIAASAALFGELGG